MRARQSGLSLLEVLIAIVILGVGLLGLAHMQASGLTSIERAYQRSQATVLAYAIADQIRANLPFANLYLTSYMAPDQAEAQSDCLTTGGCGAAEMAENDLYQWNAALTEALPGATGAITFDGESYTVAIAWDDNRDGTADSDDPTFTMSFQP